MLGFDSGEECEGDDKESQPRQTTTRTRERHRDTSDAVRARLDEVADLLFARAWSHARIKRELTAKWGISERQVRRYISVARGKFTRANADDPGMDRAQAREFLKASIERYEAMGTPAGISAAARLTEHLLKLEGLMVERVDVKHTGQLDPGASALAAQLERLLPRPAAVIDTTAIVRPALEGEKK